MAILDPTVTPLRLDPTNAARQKAHRARQKAARNVTGRVATKKAASTRPSIPWAVWPLGTVTVGLMCVSLVHLSGGIEDLTSVPSWQGWSMAIGIDCLLISVAVAILTAPADVRRDIGLVAHLMEGVTLLMSCGLNALAFSGGHFDLAHWAPIAFGYYVPAMISGSTYLLARLTRRAP